MRLAIAAGILGAAALLFLATTPLEAGMTVVHDCRPAQPKWPLDRDWYPMAARPDPECVPSTDGRRIRALLVAFTTAPRPLLEYHRALNKDQRAELPLLKGPPKDVALVRDALLAAGARPEDVLVVVDSEDPLPNALVSLVRDTRCGDTVVLHFSGWGSGKVYFGDRELDPSQMTDLVVALRNRGAFVVATLDTSESLAYWRQPLAGLWTGRAERPCEEIVLQPDAGGFVAFLVEEEAREQTIKPSDQSLFGLLSWHFAAAIRGRSQASVRELAHAVTTAVPESAAMPESIVVLSSDPGFVPFGERVAPAATSARASIEITSPTPTRGVARLESRTVQVRGRVAPREGVLGVAVQAMPAKLDADGSFQAQLELLPGRQRLAAVAFLRPRETVSTEIETVSTEIEVDVSPGTGMETAGRRWALVIGNEAYREEEDGWKPLRTPIRDAEEVAKTLREDFGFENEIADSAAGERPFPLLLRNASRREILRALQRLASTARPDDSVIVYYAGHGYRDEKINASYWVPIGARNDDYTDWISESDWNGLVRSFEARHVLVVADSCFGGAILNRGDPPGLPPVEPEARRHFIENAIQRTSRHLLSSGADEPVADGGGSGHSIFARAFLEGLRKYDDKVFTAEEVFARWIKPSVGGNASQLPQYDPLRQSGHQGGDFVFVRRPEPTKGP
jgi:hypothetical protein